MLPERLTAYLRYCTRLALQAPNRWDGFDLHAPDARPTALRNQIFFVGCALAALARHPHAAQEERAMAVDALADLTDRMIQRRVWAAWATETERTSLRPDPVDAGYGTYTAPLAMLFGLQGVLGGQVRYGEDPFTLRWSADVRSCYTVRELIAALAKQSQDSPEGAIRCEGDLATPSAMAALVWALRLHDLAYATEYGTSGTTWLKTLGERMAIRGPRLFNRHTLAAGWNIANRRASGSADGLEDAWALALSAPLDRELIAGLAERYWAGADKLRERGDALSLGFSYLLAVELGETQLAASLLASAEQRFGFDEDDEQGRRIKDSPVTPWVTALFAIGEAGGMARLLEAALPPLPQPEIPAPGWPEWPEWPEWPPLDLAEPQLEQDQAEERRDQAAEEEGC
ncbi:hypothetical protein OSCT_1065 [Oscillochloris trichoides DG-6]|uniref:Uncharacterized protein n=1 Tax=Oscillochloris trichoides DG-6 TaxID=765420 RepID=E1ICL4_9CHLR|nr:hypothetical protein [Oscillochloris trichoides]EFO81081.1 hypothetical protein OSCT_1065 [Oscillochloris trichoides DG-6]